MHIRIAKCVYITGILFSLSGSLTRAEWIEDTDYHVINKVFKECLLENGVYTCLANKAANAMDRAIDWDVQLFDGLVLKRNEENVSNSTEGRSASGLSSLTTAVSRFLDTHTLTLDLSEARGDSGGGGGGYGYGKVGKREKKYLYYALMAVMGIFGLSGPLILKTLAIVAGKALLASKAALIIVGSVALKKIFQNDNKDSSPKVHTHTIPLDDHDRLYNVGGYQYMNY